MLTITALAAPRPKGDSQPQPVLDRLLRGHVWATWSLWYFDSYHCIPFYGCFMKWRYPQIIQFDGFLMVSPRKTIHFRAPHLWKPAKKSQVALITVEEERLVKLRSKLSKETAGCWVRAGQSFQECLVGGDWTWLLYTLMFPYILLGRIIIPIDKLIFFRGVGQPPTRCFLFHRTLSLDLRWSVWSVLN